jgi:boron transporter
MQVESYSHQVPHPGDAAASSSSIAVASAMTRDRPTIGRIIARLHLQRFLQVKVGAGIIRDIRARGPWYWSDWKDAWNYRVVPATTLVFFSK